MNKYKRGLKVTIFAVISVFVLSVNVLAHSGRTDSNGGHRDNQNKSGLGSYHYHCGGHPAHLHPNGVCPYSASTSSSKSSNSSKKSGSSSTSTKKVTEKSQESSQQATAQPTTIDVTSIQIDNNISSIEVGNSKVLNVKITPENATNKTITWKSSDESIATISSFGVVTAKKAGTVNITASSSNGMTSTVSLNIKEEPKEETNNKTYISNSDDQDDSTIGGGAIALGLIAGGGYLGYKAYKKN